MVEGPQAVRELLLHDPESVVDVFFTDVLAERHPDIMKLANSSPATVDEVSNNVLLAMADTVTPQGVIAVARLREFGLGSLSKPKLVAICHEVRDPGNAGTVIRAADAAGADAVIMTGDSVDLHNPKLVRSTTGSIFHLPIIEHHNLQDVVNAVRAEGMTVLFVEHDMHMVRHISDWVVVMAEGKIVAEGPPNEVMKNPAVIDAYLGAHHDSDLGADKIAKGK